MNKLQVAKILRIGIVTTAVMLIFELLFSIPSISSTITQWVSEQSGWLIYGAIWLLMFIQATIIPIPAVTVLTASIGANVLDISAGAFGTFGLASTWVFSLVVLSAYMGGACLTYWIGRKWGKKAIKWAAGSEEEYNKWAEFVSKKGKWPYALTVLLPVFPDDLLCLVAGSVKLDVMFFFIVNLIGRFIGLIVMIFSLIVIGSGTGGWLAPTAWAVGLIAQITIERILSYKIKRENNEKI